MNSLWGIDISEFSPSWFVLVMATGLSFLVLHESPYQAAWLKACSYPMYAVTLAIHVFLNIALIKHGLKLMRVKGFKRCFEYYFLNLSKHHFWGAYCMATFTIIDSVIVTGSQFPARVSIIHLLLWLDLGFSLFCGLGILLCVFKHSRAGKTDSAAEGLQTLLFLPDMALIVGAVTGCFMRISDLLAANSGETVKPLILVITLCVWLVVFLLGLSVFSVYSWSLFVNRIPSLGRILAAFLFIAPCGQGAFGMCLLTNSVRSPFEKTENDEYRFMAVIAIGYMIGYLFAVILLSIGIASTLYGAARVYWSKHKIHGFQKEWLVMAFPCGTMALGCNLMYLHYSDAFLVKAIRGVGFVYSAATVLLTCYSLFKLGVVLARKTRVQDTSIL